MNCRYIASRRIRKIPNAQDRTSEIAAMMTIVERSKGDNSYPPMLYQQT